MHSTGKSYFWWNGMTTLSDFIKIIGKPLFVTILLLRSDLNKQIWFVNIDNDIVDVTIVIQVANKVWSHWNISCQIKLVIQFSRFTLNWLPLLPPPQPPTTHHTLWLLLNILTFCPKSQKKLKPLSYVNLWQEWIIVLLGVWIGSELIGYFPPVIKNRRV